LRLRKFAVQGFRCLADPGEVSLGRPTIITGPNDGGKTSLLLALAVLLNDQRVQEPDLTHALPDEEPPTGRSNDRFAECRVEGVFELSSKEQEVLGLGPEVRLRRIASPSTQSLEILQDVPTDAALRDIEAKTLAELKDAVESLGLQPDGPLNQKESFRIPLRKRAGESETEEVWVKASNEVAAALPRLIMFTSTAEPSPEKEITQALREAYDRTLDDETIIAPVRAAEDTVRGRLQDAANHLREHIVERCPELEQVEVVPSVSFREGFAGIELRSSKPDQGAVDLASSGAGTRRRITLAVWEWTQNLLEKGQPGDRPVVIAYDEPDTHLDYGHQRDLVDLLRKQAELEHVAVIVATHSMNLIDKVQIEDVLHVDLVDNRTEIKQIFGGDSEEETEFLGNIAASMGLRNSVLLHERCFVGVEGATEEHSLPALFRVATGLSLAAAGIVLVPAGGNTGARVLCEYMSKHNRLVRFIVDRDSTGQEVFSKKKLEEDGIPEDHMYIVGSRHEIEDLFSDEQWLSVVQAQWPRSDGWPWEVAQIAALRKMSGKFSKRLHKLLRSESANPPESKSQLLPALSRTIQTRNEVPEQLRNVFDDLVKIASVR
jgi:putative ATP-dependent endonuclease of OLD family